MPDGLPSRRIRAVFVIVAMGVGSTVLLFGAVRGNSTVDTLTTASQLASANLENAYYRCLDVQTRSLVTPDQPVVVSQEGNVDDLLRAAGRWLRAAPAGDTAAPELRIVAKSGSGTCHGSVIEGSFESSRHRRVVRIGTGASVPGVGVLPRPEL